MKANPVNSTLIVTTLSNREYWATELEYEDVHHIVVDTDTSVSIDPNVEKYVALTHYPMIITHVSHGTIDVAKQYNWQC
jgi:hypothetical protein